MNSSSRAGWSAAASSEFVQLDVACNDALIRCTQTGGANIDELIELFAEDATCVAVSVREVVGVASTSFAWQGLDSGRLLGANRALPASGRNQRDRLVGSPGRLPGRASRYDLQPTWGRALGADAAGERRQHQAGGGRSRSRGLRANAPRRESVTRFSSWRHPASPTVLRTDLR